MPRGFDPATAIKKSAIETCTFAAPYAILHAVFCWIGLRLLADRRIVLCAINRELNVFRSWRCDVERDLFGALVVSVKFGRIGTKGRTIRHTMADEATAERFLRGALARRASAQKRCGAAYRTVESVGFDEFARPPAAQ
jgi:hypothetical protein